jgi:tRNA modification GTPase
VFRSSQGNIIDRGMAIYFKAPHSFTGEDIVEFQLHGSLAVIKELFNLLGSLEGLRPAEPGEFSRRAFLNGKMDLMEAEGLADLIEAETPAQKVQAIRQMDGKISSYYNDLRQEMIKCLALLEAYIDFPDEDIPESVLQNIESDINELQNSIQTALDDQHRGERLRDGIYIVILGAPNAGKSSLLNILARRDAAIVSAKAGTTRDIVEIHMDIAGYPVILADTAGLRQTDDDIEQEGVKRALARAGEADIKLVLFDGEKWPEMDAASEALIDNNTLIIINKSDLLAASKKDYAGTKHSALYVSTKTGHHIDLLIENLEKRIVSFFSSQAAPFITRESHLILLKECTQYLENSLQDISLELKCEELRQAANAVGKITGKIQVDDVLDVIFRQFCIGK